MLQCSSYTSVYDSYGSIQYRAIRLARPPPGFTLCIKVHKYTSGVRHESRQCAPQRTLQRHHQRTVLDVLGVIRSVTFTVYVCTCQNALKIMSFKSLVKLHLTTYALRAPCQCPCRHQCPRHLIGLRNSSRLVILQRHLCTEI